MSVCVSNAGVTLGVDAMSLSQMALPSAMMLPLGHSSASSMMSSAGMLVGMDAGSTGMPLPNGLHHNNNNNATVGQNGHGGLTIGALSHGSSSSSSSSNGGIAGQTTSVAAAAVTGTELIGGDHHPNPEMLLALIARNKALEDTWYGKKFDLDSLVEEMKLVLLTTLVVCSLLCTISEGYSAAPLLFRHLEYVPSLDYLRSVLRVSSESIQSVIVNPSLTLAYDVPKMVTMMGYVLKNVTQASDVIATSLGDWSESKVRPLSDALHAIRHSLAEMNFNYPEYYRGQPLTEELNLLKGLMEEQLDSLELDGRELVRGQLQLINSFLTVASSHVIANTLILHELFEIERTRVFLNQLFIPSELEATVLHDLLAIGARTSAYDQLYSTTFNSESEFFLRFTTEGGQLLQTVLNGAPSLPGKLHRAVAEFNAHVDNFVQYTTGELQDVRHVLQERATKAFDDTIQTGYGVQASGMAMLRPLPRNLPCVRHMLPTVKSIVGSRLISISLCSNELTDFIYEQAIEYRDTVRQLEQQALAKLQMAASCTSTGCDVFYSDALEFLRAGTEKVRSFAPTIDTYQDMLLACVNGKAQGAMSQLIEEIVAFNKCIAARKASSDEDTLSD